MTGECKWSKNARCVHSLIHMSYSSLPVYLNDIMNQGCGIFMCSGYPGWVDASPVLVVEKHPMGPHAAEEHPWEPLLGCSRVRGLGAEEGCRSAKGILGALASNNLWKHSTYSVPVVFMHLIMKCMNNVWALFILCAIVQVHKFHWCTNQVDRHRSQERCELRGNQAGERVCEGAALSWC